MLPTLAYIDPGSGAILWQSIVAVGLGSLFYVRRFFRWIRGRRDKGNP